MAMDVRSLKMVVPMATEGAVVYKTVKSIEPKVQQVVEYLDRPGADSVLQASNGGKDEHGQNRGTTTQNARSFDQIMDELNSAHKQERARARREFLGLGEAVGSKVSSFARRVDQYMDNMMDYWKEKWGIVSDSTPHKTKTLQPPKDDPQFRDYTTLANTVENTNANDVLITRENAKDRVIDANSPFATITNGLAKNLFSDEIPADDAKSSIMKEAADTVTKGGMSGLSDRLAALQDAFGGLVDMTEYGSSGSAAKHDDGPGQPA